MRCIALMLLLAAASTCTLGSSIEPAPTPVPLGSAAVTAAELELDAEVAADIDGDANESSDAEAAASKACMEKIEKVITLANENGPSSPKKDLLQTVKAATQAAEACQDKPLPLGTALAKRAGALMDLGDSIQAIHDEWAALGVTGALNFTQQNYVSSVAATNPEVEEKIRRKRIDELTWMAREFFNFGQELLTAGQQDLGREAMRASQQYVAQRWALQSSLHGIRRAAKQEVLDTAELTRRASNPATRDARLAPNPSIVTHTNAAIGEHNELLTWPDGNGKAAARMRPAGVRTLVPDLQAHIAELDDGGDQWDAEGGLASVTHYFHEQWGRPYGRKLPQTVPHQHLSKAFTGAVAARKSWEELEAHLAQTAPASATDASEIPSTYQYGPTKHTTTQRFWEQEVFVAEFDSVYVEGPSGTVYDDKHVYVTAHGEHAPLAKDFVGDAGAGAGTLRARELVSVPTAISLVQPRYENYYHFATEVLPRLFVLLQHLQGGNTNKRTTKPVTLDRPKFIVPMGPSFIGSYIDLMGVALEDMVVYHPDQTVVRADQLFVADWSTPLKRRVPAPLGLAALPLTKPDADSDAAEVNPDGTQSPGEPQADFGAMLSERALAADALLSGDPWLLAAGRERARQGETTEYARATQHHAEWRAAHNITAALHWQEFSGSMDRAALGVPAGSSDEAVAEAAAEAAGVTEDETLDQRDQISIAPRTLLQQVRKHFTKRLIPAPKRSLALSAKDELTELKAIEGGRAAGSKTPAKKRRRKGKKAADPPRDMVPEHEDTLSTFAGFTSPFLFDNGTVLAFPPIRTVLLLKRQAGTPRAIENAAAVRADMVSFFGEAVAAAHGDGGEQPDRKAPGVTQVRSSDIAAISALADDKAWSGVHAFNKKAAQSGLLYDRAWARLQRHMASNRTLAKTHAAASASNKDIQGGLQSVTRADGSTFTPDISALPVVARRVTVVEVDPADLPLSTALRLFMLADVVVGMHGAGLANTLFSPPSTSVVEVGLHQGGFRQYTALSAAMAHDYWLHLPPFADSYARAISGAEHIAAVVDRAAAEAGGLNEHMWGLLRDDPGQIRPGAYTSAATVQTAPLRGTLAAMLAKRSRANAASASRAVLARQALLQGGDLPTSY